MPDLPDDLTEYMQIYVVKTEHGYVTWRYGTGGNYEILHIKRRPGHKGEGKRLMRLMLREMLDEPPYDGRGTVFGFARGDNERALRFYAECGFDLFKVRGVYSDGNAVLFTAPFVHLCAVLGVG